MITYIEGDATQPVGDGAKVICHVCNDKGRWGRGFVLAVSKRWHEPEAKYHAWAETTDPKFSLGNTQFVGVAPRLVVANMIAQHGVNRVRGIPPIRYDALQQCLVQVVDVCKSYEASLHMPRIGCGLAGGDWAYVEPIINSIVVQQGINVFVYDLPKGTP